jgi:hypothetical protein
MENYEDIQYTLTCGRRVQRPSLSGLHPSPSHSRPENCQCVIVSLPGSRRLCLPAHYVPVMSAQNVRKPLNCCPQIIRPALRLAPITSAPS